MKNFVIKGCISTTLLLGICTASLHAQTRKYIDPVNMDLTVKPGNDFYQYASGNWVKNNPVPLKEVRWGTFNELREFNIQAVKKLVESAATNKTAPAGSVIRRVGDFYAAAMDSITIEKSGYNPIKNDLKEIDAINSLEQLLSHAAKMRVNGVGTAFFGLGVSQDRKQVSNYIVNISQGGTTLADRDNYLLSDARSNSIRNAYMGYIRTLFFLTGADESGAAEKATRVMRLETALAEKQMSRLEMRDPYKTYNKFTVADLDQMTSNIKWSSLLPKYNLSNPGDSLLMNAPNFFKGLNELLTKHPLEDWKTYLKWNVLKNAAPNLSSAFVNASFKFDQVVTGQKVQTPRWQRMSALTDRTLGDLLGQLYVDEYFKPIAKQRMDEMIVNLKKAFEIRINELEWMSPTTKTQALAKLSTFRPKVGYTENWRNYDGLTIKSNTYFQNLRNAAAWNYQDNISRLGQPIDRTRFGMTPPTVNASYNATMNEIQFPAGILQFPFFDPDADDAVNYGGIGAVIGHEISHGFDDSGSQYDKDGNLKNWWTDEDRAKFNERTEMLVKQYSAYTVLDTIHVNGKLTLGENIGDLGGLNAAYTAFKMTKQGQSNDLIDGFTPDQRFFLSWAQVWRGNILPENAAQLIKTDSHSPGPYRTFGPLLNMEAWYNAFDVEEGDKLYKKPEDRIKIW